MVNKQEAKRFKEVMKKGLWRERYYMVREKYFTENSLIEDGECRNFIIQAALTDNASLVRREAVRTCNVLNITSKGQIIRLRKMPNLNKMLHIKPKHMQEILFQSCIKVGIPMYPRNRKLNDDELMLVSKKFEEDYPVFYDKVDGRTTKNSAGNISRKKNKAIYYMIQNAFEQTTTERIEQFYKHHKEYKVNESQDRVK